MAIPLLASIPSLRPTRRIFNYPTHIPWQELIDFTCISTGTEFAKRHEESFDRNPKGGLTAAGRRQFRRKTGARLKPGVKKPISEMTDEEMRRKGSWAVRFYGRKGKLPPLKDKHGEPTRFALTAHAWGEPVPKTEAAARRIAEKGRRLLERYRRRKAAQR